ncbi:hypothetical protein [Comamonas composti]|uniref:hypothetical protein n=1 Tax=Comamonas composti TaxID=408558 RepID=UPI0004148E71|nr:hypothetical protein [Comamonas composti]
MGILLEILGLIITFTMLMEALQRLGINVGWLNPLSFFRRRAWKKKISTPPLYTLEHPVDVVAVLALATVQTAGVVTVQQKTGVQALLSQHLSLSETEAGNLLVASAHMLRNRALDVGELPAVLGPSAARFTDYHQQTLRTIMRAAATLEPPMNRAQKELIDGVAAFFEKKKAADSPWSSAT